MKILRNINYTRWIGIVGIWGLTMACNEFLEIDPPRTQLESVIVFSDDASAISAIRGIYSEMSRNGFSSGTSASMSALGGLSADELNNFTNNENTIAFYTNSLQPSLNSVNSSFWQPLYRFINNANGLLEGLETGSISEPVKEQLKGEAKFIRAFCYFYLVNLFGDVPIVHTTNFEENRLLHRSSVEDVYVFINQDLIEAEGSLSEDYSFSGEERIQPNRWAAMALLARVSLYTENYSDAEIYATEVINNTSLFSLLPDVNNVFLANSRESIWQLQPVNINSPTNEALTFIIQNTPPTFFALSDNLINGFESGDLRKENWISSISDNDNTWFYPHKYKDLSANLSEYSMVFRLAEQYLIRAEARARQNKLGDAIADVDAIRQRAGLALIGETNPNISQGDLLEVITHERQVELFTEWGHRWLDLKRTNKASEVLAPIKGDNWQPTDILYPLPQNELEANPELTQNPGYN
ncbi:RagB/SusD family nutrient uptake outer membrane protein [Flagellimonas sp.]|uniref:RagB/SusD family nutrient uptake outer membrane protein n=1 Tax=Flagellimonas sp. TaxID=2058762 RepID=UPI003AB28FB6